MTHSPLHSKFLRVIEIGIRLWGKNVGQRMGVGCVLAKNFIIKLWHMGPHLDPVDKKTIY